MPTSPAIYLPTPTMHRVLLRRSVRDSVSFCGLVTDSITCTIRRQRPFHIRTCATTTGKGKRRSGPVTFASLAVIAVAGAGLLTYYQLEKEKKINKVASEVVSTGKAAIGGPWILVNQDGIPKTDASYHGQYVLLYFGFSYCPDICPSELVKIGKVIDELANSKKIKNVKPIFISVDPPRDTVGQLKYYGKDFHPNFEYLTGTKDQVAAATRSFRVYFSKANENLDDDEDYLVDHSIVFYLLSPDGTFLEFFTQRAQIGDVVEKIASHVLKKKI